MLVRRGVGVVGGGIAPAGSVSVQGSPAKSSSYDEPWQCLWLPFYRNANPTVCQDYPNYPTPVSPVLPTGALDPGGVTGSVDQVVSDTAAAQRAQAQDFFTKLAGSLGLKDPTDPTACDPGAFWCNWGNLIVLGGFFVGGLVLVNLAKGAVR